MESVLARYKNLIVLVVVLFAQILGLAVQVKRTTDTESTRLIRIWAVDAVTPFEKVFAWFGNGSGNLWHNYIYLRGVRQENRDLKAEIEQLRIEHVRLIEDRSRPAACRQFSILRSSTSRRPLPRRSLARAAASSPASSTSIRASPTASGPTWP